MKLGFTQMKTPKFVIASATAIALFSVATPAFADVGSDINDNNHSSITASLEETIQEATTGLGQDANISNAGTANVSSGASSSDVNVDGVFNFEQNGAALGGEAVIFAGAEAIGGDSTANGGDLGQTAGSASGTGGGSGANSGGAGADNGATAGSGSIGASCGDVNETDCLPNASGGGTSATTGNSTAVDVALSHGGGVDAYGGDNYGKNVNVSKAGTAVAIGGHASGDGAAAAGVTNDAHIDNEVEGGSTIYGGDAMGVGNLSYSSIAQDMRVRFNW